MGKIIYQKGDVLESEVQPGAIKVIPHIVNDIGGWGSGFVVAVSNKWSQPEAAYRAWFKAGECKQLGSTVPFVLGNTQFVRVADGNTVVANMIGQHETIRSGYVPIRYVALMQSMMVVQSFCSNLIKRGFPVEIHAPKFGAGLAGGNWDFIEKLIEEIWVASSIKVVIFTL
jgi:hypothetical protein